MAKRVSFEIRKHRGQQESWQLRATLSSVAGELCFQLLRERPLSSGQCNAISLPCLHAAGIALHTFRKENTRHLINFRRHHTLLQLHPSASYMKLKPTKLPTIRPGRLHEFSSFSHWAAWCIAIVRPGCWTVRRICIHCEGWLVRVATFYFGRHPRWMEMNQAPRRRSYEKPPRTHWITAVLRAAVCSRIFGAF